MAKKVWIPSNNTQTVASSTATLVDLSAGAVSVMDQRFGELTILRTLGILSARQGAISNTVTKLSVATWVTTENVDVGDEPDINNEDPGFPFFDVMIVGPLGGDSTALTNMRGLNYMRIDSKSKRRITNLTDKYWLLCRNHGGVSLEVETFIRTLVLLH